MSTQIKGGRLPLSQKKPAASFGERFNNRLGIPDAIQAEISALGQEARWVDAKKLYLNQGYHPNGWVPFKSKALVSDFKNGNDPDGVVRRGTMILAVRSKELSDEHRTYLQDKASALVGRDRKGAQRRAAEELRRMAQGTNIKIDDSDDEDDE